MISTETYEILITDKSGIMTDYWTLIQSVTSEFDN